MVQLLKRPLPSASIRNKALGTSYYIAPEVIEKNFTEKCDIWSIGCILYAMLTGCAPFYGATDDEVLQKVKKGVYQVETLHDAGVGESCIAFIRKLLTKDPNLRISAEDALKDPWIDECFAKNNQEEGMAT